LNAASKERVIFAEGRIKSAYYDGYEIIKEREKGVIFSGIFPAGF
jgi:hypothetical protein